MPTNLLFRMLFAKGTITTGDGGGGTPSPGTGNYLFLGNRILINGDPLNFAGTV